MTRAPLLTRAFLLAATAHFLHALSFYLYLHLPGFLAGLGADEVQIGLLSGATAATAIALRPWIGRAMDLRGRRGVILLGGVLATGVSVLYTSVGELGPWIVGIRIAHGIGEAMLFASLFAYASDVVPASRRIEGIALFGVSGMLPMALGGLLGDAILARATFTHLFVTSAAFAALALLASLPLHDVAVAREREPPRGIGACARQRDLAPLWFLGVTFATALAAHFTFLKTFVLATGVGSAGLFFAAYSGSAVVLRVAFGSLPERVGPKRALFPALASLALGLFVLSRAGDAFALGAAGVLCGLGHGYVFPILLGLVVTRARPSERGAALSLFTALFDAGTLLGGPALGVLIRLAGYRFMFASAAALVAAGAIGFAAWDGRRRAEAGP